MKSISITLMTIILSLLSVHLVSQETGILTTEIAISESDTLLTSEAQDSLLVNEIDSLIVTEPAVEEEVVISVEELEQELLAYLTKRRNSRNNIVLPFLYHSENFHYSALLDPVVVFQKNGFSIIPWKVKNYHIFQNFQSLLPFEQKLGVINFFQENYDLPIPLTESFLALGDNNMNHAGIWFSKGDIFALEGLHLEASYLGQEGNWLGINETSRNFNLHLFKNYSFGEIHYNSSIIDQNISASKLNVTHELDDNPVKEQFNDISIRFYNKFLNVGVRYEKWKIDDHIRNSGILFLNRSITSPDHKLELTYEYIHQDLTDNNEKKHLFSLFHISNISIIELSNNIRFEKDTNYFSHSDLSLRLSEPLAFKFILAKTINDESENDLLKYERGIGFSYVSEGIHTLLTTGKMQKELNFAALDPEENLKIEYNFLEIRNSMKLRIKKLNLFIRNYLHYNNDYTASEKSIIPAWQTGSTFEISMDLNHNNSLSIGAHHYYFSQLWDSIDNTYIENSNLINCYFSLGISELFTIKADFINVTGEDYFPHSSDLLNDNLYYYSTHINFGINWIFIN